MDKMTVLVLFFTINAYNKLKNCIEATEPLKCKGFLCMQYQLFIAFLEHFQYKSIKCLESSVTGFY